jgi:outer membrane protein TolC
VAFTEVESALAATAHLAQREQHLAAAAEHTTAALELAQDRYDRGLTDFLTVADSQRAAFTARSGLITARRERLDNRIDLYLSLGGGFSVPLEGSTP